MYHWTFYAATYDEYIGREDVEGAHRTWCLAMETFLLLYEDSGKTCTADSKHPRRGSNLPLTKKDVIPCPSKSLDHFDGDKRDVMTKILAQGRESIRRLEAWSAETGFGNVAAPNDT